MCLTHRYYDPGTGKFLTRDPIGYAGGENLYGFCGGNPVNRHDPSGLYEDNTERGGFGKPEAGVPVIGPKGANVRRNTKEAEAVLVLAFHTFFVDKSGKIRVVGINTALEERLFLYNWYVNQVRTGRRWDYKDYPDREKSDIPPATDRGKNLHGNYLYDDYGNFNAGAVAAALGLTKFEAQKGADAAHVVDHPLHPFADAEDHGDEYIGKGFDWYIETYRNKKTHGSKK